VILGRRVMGRRVAAILGITCIALAASLVGVMVTYTLEITKKDLKIITLESQNNQLQVWLQNNITYYESQISILNSQIKDLQSWLNGLQSRVVSLEGESSSMKEEIQRIDSKIMELETSLRDLRTSLGRKVRVQFTRFEHEKFGQTDYILQVEFEIPTIGCYDAKRTPCSRYLSNLPYLEFDIKSEWIRQTARITIVAFWHLDDVIIDVNPNRADGPWTEFGKKASALVIEYVLGSQKIIVISDGNNDGFIVDANNDAYIELSIETL